MKHLKIEQNTSSIEVVDPKVIDKLYNFVLFHPVGESLDSTSNLKGNLLCSHAYGDVVDYLTTNYKDLSISVTGGIYIRFEDKNVETICATNWGDGTGITSVQASVVNNFNNEFLNNSNITKFNELKYFINFTNITDSLFSNCTSLTSVDLSNISTLGNSVFYNCSSLTTVGDTSKLNTLGDKSFYNCTSLNNTFNLPLITTINDSLFSGCINLTNVILTPTCTKIINSGFRNCSNLVSVGDLSGVTDFTGDGPFYGCSKLTSVNLNSLINSTKNSFENCTSLTTVGDLPNLKIALYAMFSNCTSLTGNLNTTNLVEVDSYAFYKTKITSIDLSNVTTILYGAFADCSNLNMDVYMPLLTKLAETKSSASNDRGIFNNSGITKIRSLGKIQYIPIGYPQDDRGNFAKCNNLTYVVLPSTLLSIGDYSFYKCPNLKTVISLATTPPSLDGTNIFNGSNASINFFVPDNSLNTYKTATNWSNYASSIQYISTYLTQYSITEIPDKLFQGMDTITVMDCSNITKIGSYAFDGCTSLGSVTFPHLTDIGASAFENCTNLEYVNLGDYCTSIGPLCFENCTNLYYITCGSTTPPTTYSTILSGAKSTCKIYVPDSLVNTYKSAAGWSAYSDKIFSYTQQNIDFPGTRA